MNDAEPDARPSVRVQVAVYAFLLSGYAQGVLRLSPDSDVTLFRVLLLPVGGYLLLTGGQAAAFAIAFGILATYTLGLAFITPYAWTSHNTAYFIHYAVLVLYFFLIRAVLQRFGPVSFHRHLTAVYVLILASCALQYLTGFAYPGIPFPDKGGLPIWIGGVNEASLAILGYLAVLFAYARLRPAGVIGAVGGVAVIWINGSRAVLLATALLLVVTALLKLTAALPRPYRRRWLVPHVAGLVTVLLMAAIAVKDVRIHMPDHDTSLHELVEEPLERIASLRLSSNYTSVDVRANLAIAGLRALYATAFLGIGPGNSRAITARFYAPRLVTSFHNFLMQCVAEYGLLALFAFALLLTLVVRRRVNPQAVAGIGVLTLGTVGTAASVFSNFYFLSCLFLLLLAPPVIDADDARAWAGDEPEARPL
jgi:hypothetical protein